MLGHDPYNLINNTTIIHRGTAAAVGRHIPDLRLDCAITREWVLESKPNLT